MSKNDAVPYEENAFAKFFFQDKEDYENYVNSMNKILESGEKDREDLIGEIQNYLDSAKELLAMGNEILAAFYYGQANAICDLLGNFYDVEEALIETTCGSDLMLLDHELFSDPEFYV